MGFLRLAVIGLMTFNTLNCFYMAGKFASGHKEVKQGKKYAIVEGIGGLIEGLLAIGLLLDL